MTWLLCAKSEATMVSSWLFQSFDGLAVAFMLCVFLAVVVGSEPKLPPHEELTKRLRNLRRKP